jgi:hypothetical protein
MLTHDSHITGCCHWLITPPTGCRRGTLPGMAHIRGMRASTSIDMTRLQESAATFSTCPDLPGKREFCGEDGSWRANTMRMMSHIYFDSGTHCEKNDVCLKFGGACVI